MVDPSKRTLFEAHFQIGLYLKETFVPNAILFYANAHKDSNRKRKISRDSKDSDEKPSGSKHHVTHHTTSPLKHPIAKPQPGRAAKQVGSHSRPGINSHTLL